MSIEKQNYDDINVCKYMIFIDLEFEFYDDISVYSRDTYTVTVSLWIITFLL